MWVHKTGCAVGAVYAQCEGTAAHRHHNRIMYVGISISTLKENVREAQILKQMIEDKLRHILSALCADGVTFIAM